MHIKFTENEREWIETDKFGWPIKKGCPESIKKSIVQKKETLDNQFSDKKKLSKKK